MTKAIREFTKDRPCNKIDIWNCFYGRGASRIGRLPSTDMVRARSIIGRHVPTKLTLQGKARLHEEGGEFRITLTPEGVEWLKKGAKRYLMNHPDKLDQMENCPIRWKKILKTFAK